MNKLPIALALLIASNTAFSATWQLAGKNSEHEYYIDKDSITGDASSRNLVLLDNLLQGRGGVKSLRHTLVINCVKNEYMFSSGEAYTDLNLQGSKLTNANFGDLNTPLIPKPNTFGMTYVTTACADIKPLNRQPQTSASDVNDLKLIESRNNKFNWQKIDKNFEIYLDSNSKYGSVVGEKNKNIPAMANFQSPVDQLGASGVRSAFLRYDINCDRPEYISLYSEAWSEENIAGQLLKYNRNTDDGRMTAINLSDVSGNINAIIVDAVCKKVKNNALILKREKENEERQRWLATPEGKKYLADEAARSKKAQEDQARKDAQDRVNHAKEFPLYALISCTINGHHTSIHACFSGDVGTEIELRNGSQYGLYKSYQFQSIGRDTTDGFVIDLRSPFQLKAQNASESLILGVKIIDRVSNKVRFEKQVSRFGVIKIGS